MATPAQILLVRIQIDDNEIPYEFTDSIIELFIDEGNSTNYACYKLIDILLIKLRKQLLESDSTGTERNDFSDLDSRRKLLESMRDKYKDDFNTEAGTGTGIYISSVKPTIAGNDV